ncbi:coenzyme F420-0:L-glutamate ligase [Leucobacter sp. UT-8R-CII-1-4]|uniref:coenzyme F420-0:L-glutamate ligase n=1 Tax=Leucobacter sp. UT-8R-CII-1-4 TaxID=3040075 RepID=UPI0024A9B0F8|nr:coenzyme F420-0:L-glutamate ligase [Leucobacter sp. UT-8R-CII-1-4]MDI6024300.1 coenzyme F420-0:L-glutamate ligase [Leucobacter sp. UT-8R-CII-1-4]
MAQANEGKALSISVDGVDYQRIPLKTHVVMPDDKLSDIVEQYAASELQDGDIFFITEKIVAITQGRSYALDEIEPRKLATFLSRYVTKTAYGIGLGMPETMEMALREVGAPRVLLASAVAAVTKAFGRRGDFYRIVGDKARSIDGPTNGTIPPYDNRVVLGPVDPHGVAREVQRQLGRDIVVMIADINDIGGNILGSNSTKEHELEVARILGDNPLGQGTQSTPMGIIRKVTGKA